MATIKLYCNTGFAGCTHTDTHDIDDAEWNAMSEQDREKMLDELASDFAFNRIEFGAYVIEDGDA